MYRFDHDDMLAQAGWLRNVAADLDGVRSSIVQSLASVGRWSGATNALGPVTTDIEARAGDLAARLRELNSPTDWWALAEGQRDELIDAWSRPRVDRESGALETWTAAAGFVAALAHLTPAERAATSAGLPAGVGEYLASYFPIPTARTEGLPFEWRERATRNLMEQNLAEMRDEADRIWLRLEDWLLHDVESERDRLLRRISLLEGWLESDRSFIMYDGSGDGRLVEVVGDLASADGIGLFVPGIGSDLDTFEQTAVHARNLVAHASNHGESIAVVAWLGYDAPLGVGANVDFATYDSAIEGHPLLVDFVDGLGALHPDVPTTVIAHSYGSVVAGWAATQGHLSADNIVIVGSPNQPAESIGDFEIRDDAAVWVGEAPHDIVTAIGDITDGWWWGDVSIGHGFDPGDCDWGGNVFEVQDVGIIDAHATYSTGQSAEAIVAIMLDRPVVNLCEN